jgi:hypothetical protein
MPALDYFQQVYVINLPHRHDRRREMAEQLARIGLGFESPPVHLFAALRPDDAGAFPSIGAHGCFLSHLGVFRDACERGYERILIFEDDLDFALDFHARIEGVVAALQQEDWSLFYGGYDFRFPVSVEPGQTLLRVFPPQAVWSAHFVGFRGEAIGEIRQMLEAMLTRQSGDPRGGPMHVDGAYAWYRKESPAKATFLAVPPLGYQRSSKTDIHSLNWWDRVAGARHVMSRLRRLRNIFKRKLPALDKKRNR